MNDCTVKLAFPQKLLKGAGLKGSSFMPAWVYNIKIILSNKSEFFKICSLNSTFGNGITYLNDFKVIGPDYNLSEYIKIVEPDKKVGNDNLIVFANNFKLSPMSENIISFNVAVNDKYTRDCIENSGDKIPHKSKMNINAYLMSDNQISNDSCLCECLDYMLQIHTDNSSLKRGEDVKIYIKCNTGQYDAIRKTYLKCSLDSGFSFIDNSSNINPDNYYLSNNRTILRWNIDYMHPAESKRIGFKVLLSDKYRDGNEILPGDKVINTFNTNGANNSTYTQAPDTVKLTYTVI